MSRSTRFLETIAVGALTVPLIVLPALTPLTVALAGSWFRLDSEHYIVLLAIWLVTLVHLLVFLSVLNGANPERSMLDHPVGPNFDVDEDTLYRFAGFLFVVGLLGLGTNMLRVVRSGVSPFGSGRTYELTFGASTVTNYMFFSLGYLAGAGPIFMAALTKKWQKRRVAWISIVSGIALIFHSVKSTILFPILIAVSAALVTGRRVRLRTWILLATAIAGGFALSNFLVRAGAEPLFAAVFRLVLLYITPAYSNFFAEVQSGSPLSFGANSLHFVRSAIERIPGFAFSAGGEGPGLVLVDEAFNTGTIFREAFRDYGWLGVYWYAFLIALYLAITIVVHSRKRSLASTYWFAVTTVQTLFIFWGNHFVKFQFLFWIGLSVVTNVVCRKRRPLAFRVYNN